MITLAIAGGIRALTSGRGIFRTPSSLNSLRPAYCAAGSPANAATGHDARTMVFNMNSGSGSSGSGSLERVPTNKLVGMLGTETDFPALKEEILARARRDFHDVVNPLCGAYHNQRQDSQAEDILLTLGATNSMFASSITAKFVASLERSESVEASSRFLIKLFAASPDTVTKTLAITLSDEARMEAVKNILMEAVPADPRTAVRYIALATGDKRCNPEHMRQLNERLLALDPTSTIHSFAGLMRRDDMGEMASENLLWMMASSENAEDIASKALIAALSDTDRQGGRATDPKAIERVSSLIVAHQKAKTPDPDEAGRIASRNRDSRPVYFFESRLAYSLGDPNQAKNASDVLIELGKFEPYTVSRMVAGQLKNPKRKEAAISVLDAIANISAEHAKKTMTNIIATLRDIDRESIITAQSFLEVRFQNHQRERVTIAAKLATSYRDARCAAAADETLVSLGAIDPFAAATGAILLLKDPSCTRKCKTFVAGLARTAPEDILRALIEHYEDPELGCHVQELFLMVTQNDIALKELALSLIQRKLGQQ